MTGRLSLVKVFSAAIAAKEPISRKRGRNRVFDDRGPGDWPADPVDRAGSA